ILLNEGEAGLALLLAQDLAEHASERVHVAAERVLFVIARAGGRVHDVDCMPPSIDALGRCIYAGLAWLPALLAATTVGKWLRRHAPLPPGAPRPVRRVPLPPAGASRSGPPTTTSACSTSACATWGRPSRTARP